MQEIADYSLQFPLLVERYYRYTGDKDFLLKMLPACDAVIDHFSKFAREDGMLCDVYDKWNLVDWPDNLRDEYDFPLTRPVGPGCHNVINAFWVGCVCVTETLKKLAGVSYTPRAETLKNAFNAAFFKKDAGVYTDTEASSHSSLHANVIPAFYGLVPEGYTESVADLICEKGMRGGVYMAFFHLKALARLGRYDEVFRLIVSEDENSWMNMIREGATTCFEAWGKDKKFNCSLCHPWASAPVTVLAEDLLGLTFDPETGEASFTPRLPEEVGHIRFTLTLGSKPQTCIYTRDGQAADGTDRACATRLYWFTTAAIICMVHATRPAGARPTASMFTPAPTFVIGRSRNRFSPKRRISGLTATTGRLKSIPIKANSIFLRASKAKRAAAARRFWCPMLPKGRLCR